MELTFWKDCASSKNVKFPSLTWFCSYNGNFKKWFAIVFLVTLDNK